MALKHGGRVPGELSTEWEESLKSAEVCLNSTQSEHI